MGDGHLLNGMADDRNPVGQQNDPNSDSGQHGEHSGASDNGKN